MRSTGHGSSHYGPCEVCHQHADTVYLLVQMRHFEFTLKEATEGGLTYHNCFSKYGHRECLSGMTAL